VTHSGLQATARCSPRKGSDTLTSGPTQPSQMELQLIQLKNATKNTKIYSYEL